MIAVDTNVLVYAVDFNEPVKGPKAVSLLESLDGNSTVLLWQVVAEFGAVLKRKAATSQIGVDVPAVLAAWLDLFPLVTPSRRTLIHAWQLQSQYQVSYWDAMLLGACLEAGVKRLYTEDVQGQPTIEGIELINPFQLKQ